MNKKKNNQKKIFDIIKSSDSNDIYEIIYDNVSDLILFLDTLGRIAHINKAGVDFSGFTEEEILGKFFLTIPGVFSKEYVKEYLRVFKKTLQGKPTKDFIGKLKEKTGKTHIMHFSTFPITINKKIQYIMVIGHDVTEELRISDSLNHTKTVIDSTSDFIISIDNNYSILTWNKIAEQVTGYTRKEVFGKKLTDLQIFDNTNYFKSWCEKNSQNDQNQYFESMIKTKDKTRKILKLSCSSIKKEGNQPTSIVIVGNEITPINEKQVQLQRGTSYLTLNKTNQDIYNLFCTLITKESKGLVITRGNIEKYIPLLRQLDIQILTLGDRDDNKFGSINTLTELENTTATFTSSNKNTIVLLDRLDYLIIQHSYPKVLQSLYQINSQISQKNALLLLRLNPDILTSSQIAILQEEFNPIPNQQIRSIEISDKLFTILYYINRQNQQLIHVSFSKIQKAIGISKATTTKRLHILKGYRLIEINKQGKMKTVHITDKGKSIIAKRKNN
jgi:PAS domain S-box-containing protein